MTTPIGPDVPGSYESDLDVMRRDALSWLAAARRMAGAGTAAAELTLADDQLSRFSAQTGLTAAYEDVQVWVTGLLAGAQRQLRDMGVGLQASADSYEAQERTASRSFDNEPPGGN